jgi:transposase
MVAARALAASVRADCSFWRCSSRTQPRQFACEGASLGSRRKRGEWAQAVGRSRGGRTSKIHCLADDRGRPVAFALTPGNVADISMAMPLLAAVARPNRLIADKAYDADSLRNWLKIRRIKAVIPSTATRTVLTRSIAPSIDVATLSSASSAVSRTGDASQQDTTASPETISPHSLSSPPSPSGSE